MTQKIKNKIKKKKDNLKDSLFTSLPDPGADSLISIVPLESPRKEENADH